MRGILFPVLLLCIITAPPVLSQTLQSYQLDTGNQTGANMGRGVAIDGDYAAVAGADLVKVYHWTGSGWNSIQTIGNESNFFGSVVSMSGEHLVLGESNINNARGRVRIFRRNADGQYVHIRTVVSNVDRNEQLFGVSVAIDGDILLVGAPWAPGTGNISDRYGEVFLFRRNHGGTDNWGLVNKFQPFQPPASKNGALEGFGYSVAVRGDRAAAGYPAAGRVMTFYPEGNTWVPLSDIDYPLGVQTDADLFGFSVAIDGSRLAVGVPQSRLSAGSTANRPGAVYYYSDVETIEGINLPLVVRHDNPGHDHYLGWSVALHKDILLAGSIVLSGVSNNTGAVVAFRQSGNIFNEVHRISRNLPESSFFGNAITVDRHGQLMIGAPWANVGGTAGGGAYNYILIPRSPANLTATNGTLPTSVTLNWQHVPGREGYRIFWNGNANSIGETNSASFGHSDRTPGTFHYYEARSYNFMGESDPARAVGHTQPNGGITGTVSTINNIGVPGVKVTATPYVSLAGVFDGTGYVDIPHTSRLNQSDNFTVEAWIYLDDISGRKGIYSTRRNNEAGSFQLEVLNNQLAVTSINTWVIVSNQLLSPQTWHHVAYVKSGDIHRLFIDGRPASERTFSFSFQANASSKSIGLGTGIDQHFKGQIDEVRVWNRTRTQQEIAATWQFRLGGNEADLAAYWPMQQVFANGSPFNAFVPDHAVGGGSYGMGVQFSRSPGASPVTQGSVTNSQGQYNISRINYSAVGNFTVTPELPGHGFNPGFRDVELGSGLTQAGNINFTDTTTFTVNGRIVFNGTTCAAPEVDMLVNGMSVAVYTDDQGNFSIPVMTPGQISITPSFNEHTFDPPSINLNVFEDVTGVQFRNTQTFDLTGKVAGGDCLLSIGGATVNARGPATCYQASRTITGNEYLFLGIPALPGLILEVLPVNSQITFNTREVSLSDTSQVLDFIYRAPPEIRLVGLPEPVGSCNLKVLKQLDYYGLGIEVTERYGNETCPVQLGEVRIYNSVADLSVPDTVQIRDGYALHEFYAGYPNIVGGGQRPHQKLIQLEVETGDPEGTYFYQDTFEEWFIVEGNRPREQTFATVTPEVPLFILRDPPGDQSYSFLDQSTTLCNTVSTSLLGSGGGTLWGLIRAGTKSSLGVGVSIETEVWKEISLTASVNYTTRTQNDVETCLIESEIFTTSDSELVTGGAGDVYIGGAMNIIYALTDVLEFNPHTCQVDLSRSVIFGQDGFATQYVYTENFIKNNLIPRLEMLRDLPATPADSVAFLADQVNVWNQTLRLNKDAKDDLKDQEPSVNYSFDGGAGPISYQSTSTSTSTTTIEYDIDVNYELAIEAGLLFGGAGFKGGVKARGRHVHGEGTVTQNQTSNTVGFVLNDNDPGDFFSVSVKNDPVFATPVFELAAGTTSCPWEPGSQPREGVQLTANTFVRNDVPAGQPAVFNLTLGNTSQSDETFDYRLAAIPGTNPDGAVILVNGIPISTLEPYTIPAGQSLGQTLTISRGPVAYDYERLQIVLRSMCDSQIADTLSLTARFATSCSPVTLAQPEDGWLVNAASNNRLQVVLRDYLRSLMSNVKLEYAVAGTSNWQTSVLISVNDLPDNQATLEWNVEGLPDGDYDFRIALQCDAGVVYTPRVRGRIDRRPLQLAGLPTPTSGILAHGDVISATFSKAINPASATAQNVVLTDLSTGLAVPIDITVNGNLLVLIPAAGPGQLNERLLQATVRNIRDVHGNAMAEAVTWPVRVRNSPIHWERLQADGSGTITGADPFVARLLNRGAVSEDFEITRHPDWLIPSPLSGQVASGDQQIVVFTPMAPLEKGIYRDTVVASTRQGEQRLLVNLSIQCDEPAWNINPATFAHSMNITTTFQVGGTPFSDKHDAAAAFVNGQLRGLAHVVPLAPAGGQSFGYVYAAMMTVYSNVNEGETIEFRLWDASECAVMTINDTMPFAAGTDIGSPSNPIGLAVAGAVLQTITLAEGHTWLSLGIEASDMNVNNVLSRIRPAEGDLIRGQTGYSQFVAGSGWVGTLNELLPGITYKATLASERRLEFIGSRVNAQERPIQLVEGWNWVGFLPEQPLAVNTALASLDFVNGDILRSQTAFSEFRDGNWLGNLNSMEPGRGYKMRRTSPGLLTYPDTEGDPVWADPGVEGLPEGNGPGWSIDASGYETLMSVTGIVNIDGIPIAGPDFLISAWAEGEIRGVARPIRVLDRWMFFLNVYGDITTGGIQFMLYDATNGTYANLNETMTFDAEKVSGSPRNPWQWTASVATSITDEGMNLPQEISLGQNYPNPFNPATRIRYALPSDGQVRLVVYNLLGQQVAILVNGQVQAGYHTVDFDASRLSSGVYFYNLQVGSYVETRKMMLIK